MKDEQFIAIVRYIETKVTDDMYKHIADTLFNKILEGCVLDVMKRRDNKRNGKEQQRKWLHTKLK